MLKNLFSIVLQLCAKRYLEKNQPYIVWITWSIGKTTSKMIISHILDVTLPEITVYTSPENFNSEIWLALSVLQIPTYSPTFLGSLWALFLWCKKIFSWSRIDVLVLEYWVDAPWDMQELLEICIPHCAIFTGLDLVHAESFWSPDEILQEKSLLLSSAKELVLYPSSATYLKDIIDSSEVDVLSFWLTPDTDSDIWFSQYRLWLDTGWRPYSILEIDQWHEEVTSVQSNLIWEVSAWYTSIWIEMAMILSRRLWTWLQLIDFLEYRLQPWRFSIFEWKNDAVIIDSTYNASPASMKQSITQTIALRNELYPEYEIIYCLGDMNELWDFSHEEHTKLAWLISQSADHIFLIWSETLYTQQELQKIWYSSKRVTTCIHSRDLGILLENYISAKDSRYLILAKSSQGGLYLEEALCTVLLHPEDQMFLPRSTEWRAKKKEEFFLKI